MATRLMQAVEGWARERGATLLLLETDIASPLSMPFYERRMAYHKRAVSFLKASPVTSHAFEVTWETWSWSACGDRGMWEGAMDEAASQQADQALGHYVRGGRTLVDIGTEFELLRRERGLSPEELAQRARLPLESVRAIESGTRLPTKTEFARLATALELSAARLAAILRPVLDHQASGIKAFS